MQPPKCRLCGVAEWQHVCSGAAPAEIGRRSERGKQQARSHGGEVTPAAGPKPLAVAMARIEELEAEVRQLKRQLAKAHGGNESSGTKPPPVTKPRNETPAG